MLLVSGLMRTLSILLEHVDGPVRYTSALCLQLAAGVLVIREQLMLQYYLLLRFAFRTCSRSGILP